jgi:hypothetical protein
MDVGKSGHDEIFAAYANQNFRNKIALFNFISISFIHHQLNNIKTVK